MVKTPTPCFYAVDINHKMAIEFIYQHVFVFSLSAMLTVKIINDARRELMSVWKTAARPFNVIHSPDVRPPPRSGLVDHLQKTDRARHPILLSFPLTSPPHPHSPTLQSPQIRFNQTTCAVWLGVRKRIISKQRSYSPRLHWHSRRVTVSHLKCSLMKSTESNHLLLLLRRLRATGN